MITNPLPTSLRWENYAIITQGNHARIYPGRLVQATTLEELKSLKKPWNIVTFLTPSSTMREAGREALWHEPILVIVSDVKEIQYMTRAKLLETLNHHGNYFEIGDFVPSVSDEVYKDNVRKVQRHIADGDICQTVLARSFTAHISGLDTMKTPLSMLARLLQIEWTAMTALFQTPEHSYLFASPERHLTIRNSRAHINPIAGTMKIGNHETLDTRLEEFLMDDEKERRELTMLLDEGIKMIARFCPHGHIEWPYIRETGAVIHTEYAISGKVVPHTHVIDALRRTLNAPTLTGSPINRACEILSQIEWITRWYYGGVFGIYKNGSNLDTTIAIRGVHLNHRKSTATITAGAGITQASDPEKEAEETQNKAQGNIAVVTGKVQKKTLSALSQTQKKRHERAMQKARNKFLSRFHFGEQKKLEPSPELIGKKVTVINFDDDFSYILGVMLESLWCEVNVLEYSDYEPSEDFLVFGGGPGDINNVKDPKMNRLREILAGRWETPLLGICLGCQAICQYLGIEVKKLSQPLQGAQKKVIISPNETLENVGQYNSFAGFGLKKWCDIFMKPDGSIDMIHCPEKKMLGVQFHPESVMTENGREILENLLLKLNKYTK